MLGFFKKKKPTFNKKERGVSADLGILVFENTSDVIQAENILKRAGWSIRVMGPPPEIQTGCDLVIEFPLIEELNILRELGNADVSPLQVVPVTEPLLAPVSLFQTKDFGDYLMVRAANMKITIDKMSGQAEAYDFFTLDVGELAFLADDLAPNPFYTRGFILHSNGNVSDLIRQAYQHQNAAKYLLVKGESDYIACEEQVPEKVDYPSFEAMEAIGGTGDTLTGLLSALLSADFKPVKAAVLAARVNRWTGYYADPTPATQVIELIEKIPQALVKLLNEHNMKDIDGR